VSRALGRDAFETKSADAPLRFEVTFTHDSSGYVATIRERGSHTGERTIASGNSSCAELTEALAAAFTVMLDSVHQEETSQATSAGASTDAAPPSPANSSTPPTEPPARTTAASEPAPKPGGLPARGWYGWQTLLVDGGTLVWVLASGVLAHGSPALEVAVAGDAVFYLAGSPIVHAVHGRWGAAFGDAALRAGFAFLGFLVGGEICMASSPRCPAPGAAGGALLSLFAATGGAVALDAAVLAYEPRKRKASSDRAQWSPIVAIDPRRIAAGLGGAF
jgi:hypothetical protein